MAAKFRLEELPPSSSSSSPTSSSPASPPAVPTPPTSPQRLTAPTSPQRLPAPPPPKEDHLDSLLYVRHPQFHYVGGYRLDLLTEAVSEDFVCGICLGVARESVQTIHCGAVFCKGCMEYAFSKVRPRRKRSSNPGLGLMGGKPPSPDTNSLKIECPKEGCSIRLAVDGQYPDTRHQNQVSKLQVACPLQSLRCCPWTGTILDLVGSHINECELVREPCPNGCGLNELRGQLGFHLIERCGKRQVPCEYCGLHIESRLLNEHHASKDCPEYPVPCPNKCMNGDRRQYLPRSQVAAHVSGVCPLEVVTCPYLAHGCADQSARQDLHTHLNNSVSIHLDLIRKCSVDGLSKCRTDIDGHAAGIEWVRNELADSSTRLNNSLSELSIGINAKCEAIEERVTEVSEVVTRCQEKVETTDAVVERLRVGEGRTEEFESLQEEFQKVSEENKRLKAALSNCNKRVSLLEELNVWGSYTWIIKSVSEKLKVKQFFYSDPFYTSPSGYRVCVSLALNGFGPGEGTHLGLGLFMMKGRNDPYLTWPFAGTRKYILINHAPGGKHYTWQNSDSSDKAFQRPMEERGETGHGCPQFISHKELFPQTDKVQYIKDDTLILRIIVKPSDCPNCT